MTEKMDVDDKKPADSKDTKESVADPRKDVDMLTFESLREQCRTIQRAEQEKEPRMIARLLRSLNSTRRNLNGSVLHRLIGFYVNPAAVGQDSKLANVQKLLAKMIKRPASSAKLSAALETDMDTSDGTKSPLRTGASTVSNLAVTKSPRTPRTVPPTPPESVSVLLPEIEAYILLLVTLYLYDQGRRNEALECAAALLSRLDAHNRRTLDPLAARALYYNALLHERAGRLSELITPYLARWRTASYHHDTDSVAALVNCILRAYVLTQQYDFAERFITKTDFPEAANNNEWARQHYYRALIRANQGLYQEAWNNLLQASRKAPTHTAVGFKQQVQKLTVVVDLLRGEIPERPMFRQPMFKKALLPYLYLTQAVRTGDLPKFGKILDEMGDSFRRDRTYSLIARLRQNVVRTAVRQISLAYSRIGLADVAAKLATTDVDEARLIIQKAIHDGVIEAQLVEDPQLGEYMQSKEPLDVYSTAEPQYKFHQRIQFCLELYQQAVKALRYPATETRGGETAEQQRERELAELEFARELAEEDDDF